MNRHRRQNAADYEIGLNAKNAAALRKQLVPYIEHARRAGRAQGRRAGRTAASRPPGTTSTIEAQRRLKECGQQAEQFTEWVYACGGKSCG